MYAASVFVYVVLSILIDPDIGEGPCLHVWCGKRISFTCPALTVRCEDRLEPCVPIPGKPGICSIIYEADGTNYQYPAVEIVSSGSSEVCFINSYIPCTKRRPCTRCELRSPVYPFLGHICKADSTNPWEYVSLHPDFVLSGDCNNGGGPLP